MSQLPVRPDLDQLRRQARELHRAAQLGETTSLRRLHAVSDKVTLSTAQLASPASTASLAGVGSGTRWNGAGPPCRILNVKARGGTGPR